MTAPMTAKQMPKQGGQLAFQGTPVSYTPNPFMVQMENGTLVVPKGTTQAATPKKTPARKAPVRKK